MSEDRLFGFVEDAEAGAKTADRASRHERPTQDENRPTLGRSERFAVLQPASDDHLPHQWDEGPSASPPPPNERSAARDACFYPGLSQNGSTIRAPKIGMGGQPLKTAVPRNTAVLEISYAAAAATSVHSPDTSGASDAAPRQSRAAVHSQAQRAPCARRSRSGGHARPGR